MEQALLNLWNKYRGQMASEELNAILERGICYAKTEGTHRILVTGMNPSFRKGDPACDQYILPFDYQAVVKGGEDRYFTAFDKLFPAEYRREVAYLDLLNIRETEQQTVWKFCQDPQGLALVAENLRLNQMLIEKVIRPRLIMVKNRGSWCFWGKEATADENIWMGYRFEPVEGFDTLPCGELLCITGLIDHPARIARHQLPATHLQGTLVLFTSHFGRRTPETLPTPELLEKLCKMI